MVEERKSGSLEFVAVGEEEEAGVYNDLMDLITTGEDDDEPSVMHEMPITPSGVEPNAIPFVTVSDDDELEISTEAMELLDGMQHHKIAVIALCGSSRTGKSFLANRYLGRMQGFKTRGLLGSGTRGIWIWNQMVPLANDVDGIVLDC